MPFHRTGGVSPGGSGAGSSTLHIAFCRTRHDSNWLPSFTHRKQRLELIWAWLFVHENTQAQPRDGALELGCDERHSAHMLLTAPPESWHGAHRAVCSPTLLGTQWDPKTSHGTKLFQSTWKPRSLPKALLLVEHIKHKGITGRTLHVPLNIYWQLRWASPSNGGRNSRTKIRCKTISCFSNTFAYYEKAPY